MSVADASVFLTRLRDDADLRKRLESASSDDARKKVLSGLGLHFTKDEVKQAAGEQGRNLSERELGSVSGGAEEGAGAAVIGAVIASI